MQSMFFATLVTMPEWWGAMTTAEKFAAIGGLAGLLSVIVTMFIAWDSRTTAKKQLDLASEANATTRMAVDDQIAANRLSRSASLRIAEATFMGRENPHYLRYLSNVDQVAENKIVGVVLLTIINEGMSPASNVNVKANELMPSGVEGSKSMSLHKDEDLFASLPMWDFLSIPPGHSEEVGFAMRNAGHLGERIYTQYFTFRLSYRDGLGIHRRVFRVMLMGLPDILASGGTISEDAEAASVIDPAVLSNLFGDQSRGRSQEL